MSKSLSAAGPLVLLLVAAPALAQPPRIAVVGVAGDKASQDLRERMARAVADGLAASGAEVRTEPSTVTYRVRGTLEVEGRTYLLRLEIIDAKTGAVVDSREDRCEICTESEALETAGVAASALKAQVFKRRPALSVEAGLTAPPPPAPPPAAAVQSSPPAGQEPSLEQHPHRGLGVAGVVIGALAAGGGAFLLSLHNNPTDCGPGDMRTQCMNKWHTAPAGIALLVGGGLAVTAGILAVSGVF